jgi:dihydroceramidase
MVWLMLLYIYVLYSPDWHYTSTMPTVLFIYGTVYAIGHALFHFKLVYQLHFVFLCLLCLPRMYKYYIYTKEVPARRLGRMYVISISLGGIFWLVDRNFCNRLSTLPVNPQGHAWWHIFMGFSAYFGNTFLQFCRAHQLEWNPELRYVLGWLPYVKVSKPKSQ